jgi:lysozyme family protein
MSKFAVFVERILEHEGGYVNHPNDPGGETNYGIAKRSYPALNIKELSREDAKHIYFRDFWQKVGGDELPDAFAFQALDAAVNHGIGNAVRWMQDAAGVAPDGVYGPVSRAAVRAADPADLVFRFNATRLEFYVRLSTFPTFGKGWIRRVAGNLRLAAKDN